VSPARPLLFSAADRTVGGCQERSHRYVGR
jgi:hypothetical protein